MGDTLALEAELGARTALCLRDMNLVVHVGLAILTARRTFVTVDETGHIASGVAHPQQASFASYRVNPPPARWFATLLVVRLFHPPTLAPLVDKPGARPEGTYGAELATRGVGVPLVRECSWTIVV